MKRKTPNQIQPQKIAMRRDEQVRAEMENFFLAIESYAARAIDDPELTFHEHLCSLLCEDGRNPQ